MGGGGLFACYINIKTSCACVWACASLLVFASMRDSETDNERKKRGRAMNEFAQRVLVRE